jgi:hypothetical protein
LKPGPPEHKAEVIIAGPTMGLGNIFVPKGNLLASVILKRTDYKGSNVCGSFDKSPLIIPE